MLMNKIEQFKKNNNKKQSLINIQSQKINK